jgi:hypothetical protein
LGLLPKLKIQISFVGAIRTIPNEADPLFSYSRKLNFSHGYFSLFANFFSFESSKKEAKKNKNMML